MTIGANSLIECSINGTYLAQQWSMVFQYQIGDFVGTPTAVQIAEAYWNDIKTTTRALAATGLLTAFQTVKLRELNNPAGDYATYDIPVGEQAGTRTTGTGDGMPPYVAVGVQLVVGTRTTRPGQKRMPFVTEGDNANGALGASLKTITQTWAAHMIFVMVLGAPAALTELEPIVVRKDVNGFVTASQFITGYIVNNNLTTQNSRKIGRGI